MAQVERGATRILGFASAEMDFQLMRMLGAANAGGGAAGEIFAARARMGEDPSAWPAAFAALAEGLEHQAAEAAGRGHRHSAAGHLLRASSYWRSAEYFSDPFGEEGRGFGIASRRAFIAAAADLPHRIEPVDIPFGATPLPGYFMQPVGGARDGRTLVVMTGFDGTGEELYFQSAADGLVRGFNLLIAEGPGQVGCLRRHPDLLFRPDYQVPIAAILDYALSRPEVAAERLALYGISLGGYFVLRAAAHDRRIRALVANSPILDLHAYLSSFSSGGETEGDSDVSLDMLPEIPDEAMPQATKLAFKAACRRFGVDRYSAWLEALKSYRIEDPGRIRCPVLALAGAGEGAETRRQYDALLAAAVGPATGRLFTVEEGADMHCQLGNLPLSNAVVYDWLEEAFGGG